MTSFNRFIKFNDEQVDAKQLISYEKLARALANAPYLKVTERKLMEFRPSEGALSYSFFWKHRPKEVERAGQKTDIYLLSAGFWRHFDIGSYKRFVQSMELHPLTHLAVQLAILFEEFRLIELVSLERPGTTSLFSVRTNVLGSYHHDQLSENMRKGFLSDALMNYVYVTIQQGSIYSSTLSCPTYFYAILPTLERIYELTDTRSSMELAKRVIERVEELLEGDLVHTFYSIGDELLKEETFHYHQGVKDPQKGEEEEKDTIEEIFMAWHRENEREKGIHLHYELEHGQSGKAGANVNEGREDADITETGIGHSSGKSNKKSAMDPTEDRLDSGKKSGATFGDAHTHVVYEERRIVFAKSEGNAAILERWRAEQEPYVREFVKELSKRMEQKTGDRREHLSIGRLSSNLIPLFTDERPRPFYRKRMPTKQLDAVFGLLVDGSASMTDKLEETKKAVLLFHDILRRLGISQEIVLFYEDAFEATETEQPNTFEWIHKLEDGMADSGQAILSIEAHEDNRDGFAIRWMVERLRNRPEKHKFLMIFSDGEPSAFGYDQNGLLDTANAVIAAEKTGISILHLFLNVTPPSEEQKQLFRMMYGAKSAASDSVEDFSDQTLRILRKILSLVVQST